MSGVRIGNQQQSVYGVRIGAGDTIVSSSGAPASGLGNAGYVFRLSPAGNFRAQPSFDERNFPRG